MKKSNICWIIGIPVTALIFSVLALGMGQFSMTPGEVMAVLLPNAFPGIETTNTMHTVVLNIRLPRILLALLAGAGLSVAGAAFQALFSNPLATPDTLGVATGASFGAVLAILFGLSAMTIQLFALGTGLLAVALVYIVGRTRGGSPMIMIVLAGMVISALFSALVSLIKYVADPQDVLPAITFWMMGNMQNATWETLLLGIPFIVGGIIIVFLFRWKLNAMSLPEDEATALGIPVRRIRVIVTIGATMITASVVSMCGLISWVGLLIPHISRMIFGSSNKRVIPAAIGLGAVFMVVIDTAARCLTAAEIPVSILTAVIGAPFFIILLRRTGGIKGN
ncbi:MAG: iron ABC transporter permease [Oscillospiraceae bacterium]|nr:iron ABC transporter permease [Oscillospiraceae bacterium]